MNSIVALPIASAMPIASPAMSLSLPDAEDQRLLELEAIILEHQQANDALMPEAERLQNIWSDELIRLQQAALTGQCALTAKEQWSVVTAMPEAKEHTRVVALMRPHDEVIEDAIKKMWAIPAKTAEGKAAKLLVLLSSLMGDDWREHDGVVDYEIKMARDLMIELVGGEPAAQLRDQFAV